MTTATDDVFHCRGCGATTTECVLDLGQVPASDLFPPLDEVARDPAWPLQLWLCRTCWLAQLGPSAHLDPEPPRAVESATALAHAAASAREIVATEGMITGQEVIEVDSHHGGSWLTGFVDAGLVPVDVHGQADLVADVHGLAHESDLRAPLAAHAQRLKPNARLVLEFHHLLPLVHQSQIDTIRHGHCVYLSLITMSKLLAEHGLVATRAVSVPVFGGSLRLTAARTQDRPAIHSSVNAVVAAERAAGLDNVATYRTFGTQGHRVATSLREHLQQLRASGRTVAGYGAPSKAPVLVSLAKIDESLLPYTVDIAKAKQGRRLPGTRIPIRSPEYLLASQPGELIIFTWDIADEIVDQVTRAARNHNWTPRFYTPLPAPGYLA